MLDPDDGDAAVADAAHQRHQRFRFIVGQPARDLVQQQQLRIRRQRARQFQPLAVEQRQGTGRDIGLVGKLAIAQHLGAEGIALLLRPAAAERGGDQQVLESGHAGIGTRDLIGPSDPHLAATEGRLAAQRRVAELDLAAGRLQIAADHVEQRRLARPVRAEDAQHLAPTHVETHLMQDADGAEGLRHAARRQQDFPIHRSVRVPAHVTRRSA
ncbi:hypothetical protein ACVILI_005404 [Mesorhizobium sp. USDA 4775]